MKTIKLICARLRGAWLVLRGKYLAVPCHAAGNSATERLVRQHTMLYAANVNNFLFVYKSGKGEYFFECLYENEKERENLFNIEG